VFAQVRDYGRDAAIWEHERALLEFDVLEEDL
jgi:hypothetical protein